MPKLTMRRLSNPRRSSWRHYAGGIYWIGSADAGFAFDNEQPRHRVLLATFRLASRLVTCGEYLHFIEMAGYRRPEFWLSDGWSFVQSPDIRAPHYWIGSFRAIGRFSG